MKHSLRISLITFQRLKYWGLIMYFQKETGKEQNIFSFIHQVIKVVGKGGTTLSLFMDVGNAGKKTNMNILEKAT